MDLVLEVFSLLRNSVLELLSRWLDGLVEMLFQVTVGLVASIESVSLHNLNALPHLFNVWVHVSEEVGLGGLNLVFNLVVLEESSGVNVLV